MEYRDRLLVPHDRPKLDLMEIGMVFSGLCCSDSEEIRREDPPYRVKGYRYGHPIVPFYVDTKVRDSDTRRGGIVLARFHGDGWLLTATMRHKQIVALGGGLVHNVYKADWNYSLAGDVDAFTEAWMTAILLFRGNQNILNGYTFGE